MKLKKLVTITSLLLVSVFGVFLFARQAGASTNYQQWLDDTEMGEGNMEQWGDENWSNDLFAALTIFTGRPTDMGLAKGGALPFAGQMIADVLTRPAASGSHYAYSVIQNIGGKPAYAQGIGFTGLQPLLPIWKGFRNTAYIVFTIVFVIIGMAIMFRVKISPQAVITIENAIPKIIGGLILVTFSYAIAGFIIDLSYVLLALVIRILIAAGLNLPGTSFQDMVIFNLSDVFQILWPRAIPHGAIIGIGAVLGGVVGAILGVGALSVPFALGGVVAGIALIELIITGVLLYHILKFFFALAKSYINIILQIILAPVMILAGAFPGMQTQYSFSTWLKNLVAHVMVFPVCALFIIIAAMIIDAGKSGLWRPHLLGITSGGGSMSQGVISAIIGIGVFMLLSKLPDLIIQNLFAIKPSPYGTAATAGLGGIMAPIRAGWGMVQPGLVGGGFGAVDRKLGDMETAPGGSGRKIFGRPIAQWRRGLKSARNSLASSRKSTPAP